MPQSEAGPPDVPGLRDVPGARGPADAGSGSARLAPTPASTFLALRDPPEPARAFVFPGQGAQTVGMGKDIYEQFPAARELYDRADEILGIPLSRICFEGPEEELQRTENTQPAIAVTSLALLRVATDLQPKLLDRPAFVAGHSLGEYPALVAAGALSFDDAVRLLRTRGELMAAAGSERPGTMAAVIGLDVTECEDVCREAGAEICTINAPGQIVIGGQRDSVVRALDYAQARGAKKVIPLSVSGAFHSSLMRSAAEGMVNPVATTTFAELQVPIVANCTATALQESTALRNELVDQVHRPVQWARTVEFLGEQGIDTFIEFGPGRVLSGIIKRMLRRATCITVNSAESAQVDL